MSAKEQYSTNVEIARQQAKESTQAAANWAKGESELKRYGKNWEALNINDYIPPFHDESLVIIKGRKMFFPTKDRNIAIIADFGGGYLRFMDMSTHSYVDRHGNPISKNDKDFEEKTHYRILKKEEM